MNRGMWQTSPVMATGNLYWQWNPNAIPPPPLPLPPSTPIPFHASPSMFQPYQQPPSLLLSSSAWNDNQEFPESWCQLLGSLVGDYESHGNTNMKRTAENLEHQVPIPSSNTYMTQVKREVLNGGFVYSQHQEHHNQVLQTTASSSRQISHLVSSPTSCTSYSSNVFDFSSGKSKKQPISSDRSPECNSSATGAAVKKAKLQAAGAGQSSFKGRKVKLGDRVTALHQLVSPFGKTDTASVLLEAIGYIRFLQAQIAALSSPYMDTAPGSLTHPVKGETEGCGCPQDSDQQKVADEPKKDLRSRGLCLVPVYRILNAGSENGAGFWPAAAGAGFQCDR
ncbi:transcription factor bHLH68-like isoform X3 [Nymphaea colorata]|uniref:transcription factor bHLH68-like isoform X3 n=1 Tax=Nymphaea colorata TaxID=210225 RepID=UPI00129D99D4|nr:transcription factor bHLH68-like isoform X3 [Nymphaea colorata]